MSGNGDIVGRLHAAAPEIREGARLRKQVLEQAAEIKRLRAIVERVAKLTKDNQWVIPGDRVWIKTENGPRWFKLTDSFTVPLSIPVHNPDCERSGWRELTVEECYSTEEAAR